MKALSRVLVCILLWASVGVRAHAHDLTQSSIATGRDLAQTLCAACHVVAPNQERPPTLLHPAPSFETIANDPNTTRRSLADFLKKTHWDQKTVPITMPDLMLPDDEKSQIIGYILSLRKTP